MACSQVYNAVAWAFVVAVEYLQLVLVVDAKNISLCIRTYKNIMWLMSSSYICPCWWFLRKVDNMSNYLIQHKLKSVKWHTDMRLLKYYNSFCAELLLYNSFTLLSYLLPQIGGAFVCFYYRAVTIFDKRTVTICTLTINDNCTSTCGRLFLTIARCIL